MAAPKLGYRPKSAFVCSLFLQASIALAAPPTLNLTTSAGDFKAYDVLRSKAQSIQEKNTSDGWAYVVSGGVALAVSIPGYYLSDDVFAKTVYSLGQTIAVGSIGFGAYLLLIEDDYTRFFQIIEKTPQLSPDEKNRLAHHFLAQNAERARRVRKIRVISHSLTAGLNFLSAATSDNKDLRTALYFVGGVNVLAALNFAFRRSEEEVHFQKISWQPEPLVGPRFVGVQWRF